MIYFIQAGGDGPIKIGHAKSARDRQKMLQVGNHERLRLLAAIPGSREREKAIHYDLSVFRYRGEWFHPNGEVFDCINRAKWVDYEFVGGVPLAILWRKNKAWIAYCPFCGEKHSHEGEDGHYKTACLPNRQRYRSRTSKDGTVIKRVDGYIIRTNKKLPLGFGEA